MLMPEQVPQNYNQQQQNPVAQYLQQILASRKQQGAGMDVPSMPAVGNNVPQSQGQMPQSQSVNPMEGIQSLSKLLGYAPNTTFGYDMSGAAGTPQGPTQTGAPVQNPSMNLQQAIGNQSPMAMLQNIIGW